MGSTVSQETPNPPLIFFLIGHKGAAYLHDNEKVEDQDEGGQEGSGDLIAGKEASVQIVPADPVSADDQNHHRRQRDEHRPAGWEKNKREVTGGQRKNDAQITLLPHITCIKYCSTYQTSSPGFE